MVFWYFNFAASGDSQSEDDDEDDDVLRLSQSSSPRWGAGRGGLSTAGSPVRLAQRARLDNDHGDGSALAMAKTYEEDEDACFARVKDLWEEKVCAAEFRGGGKRVKIGAVLVLF